MRHSSYGGAHMADISALLGESTLKQQAMDFAVLGSAAVAGVVAGRLVRKQGLDRLTLLPDLAKPLLLAVGGFGAGIALQKFDRRAAAGFAAGVIVDAVGSFIAQFVPFLGAVTEEELLLGTGSDGALARELLSGPRGATQFDVDGLSDDVSGFDIEETGRQNALSAIVG